MGTLPSQHPQHFLLYVDVHSLYGHHNGLLTDTPRTSNGHTVGSTWIPDGRSTDCTRAWNGRATDKIRTEHRHIRTGYGPPLRTHTDLERTGYGQIRTRHGLKTDGPRFGLRVGSWILVFWKRRAGKIATLRLYHKTRQPDAHRRKR